MYAALSSRVLHCCDQMNADPIYFVQHVHQRLLLVNVEVAILLGGEVCTFFPAAAPGQATDRPPGSAEIKLGQAQQSLCQSLAGLEKKWWCKEGRDQKCPKMLFSMFFSIFT